MWGQAADFGGGLHAHATGNWQQLVRAEQHEVAAEKWKARKARGRKRSNSSLSAEQLSLKAL